MIPRVPPPAKRRGFTVRLRDAGTEARRSPMLRGLALGVCGAAVARGSGQNWRAAAGLGMASGVFQHALLAGEQRLAREARNAGDAAALAAWLGESTPPMGAWAIEPDFGRLVASELMRSPATVVECGSGTTTLLIGRLLRRNGRGRLFSLEHDRSFAERTQQQVDTAGLSDVCRVIWAPLGRQSFGSRIVPWYDPAKVSELPRGIDLLVVDGPPAVVPWARWPALEVLMDRLGPGATVLVDDGRRRDEQRTVFRWRAEHSGLSVEWHDTVKGTWRLQKSDDRPSPGLAAAAYQRARRALHPRPPGFGRWPVAR
jgi:predicted O-methyltransferase YrrM